jgi:hypothetical protein
MRVPPRRRRLAPAQPEIQHIPVGPRRMRLKPLCIQQFRGVSSVQSGEPVQQHVFNPIPGLHRIEAVFRASGSSDNVTAIQAQGLLCRIG